MFPAPHAPTTDAAALGEAPWDAGTVWITGAPYLAAPPCPQFQGQWKGRHIPKTHVHGHVDRAAQAEPWLLSEGGPTHLPSFLSTAGDTQPQAGQVLPL